MKHKRRNPYKPLRFHEGETMAMSACPDWRMVTLVVPGAWHERDYSGDGGWRDGVAPAPVGIVCDREWRPVQVKTRSGRVLPNLRTEWEEVD